MARIYEVVGMKCDVHGVDGCNSPSCAIWRKKVEPAAKLKISFADLSPDERQAFADFQLKERFRHESDIDRIDQDLAWIADQFDIRPRAIFVGVWINCEK